MPETTDFDVAVKKISERIVIAERNRNAALVKFHEESYHRKIVLNQVKAEIIASATSLDIKVKKMSDAEAERMARIDTRYINVVSSEITTEHTYLDCQTLVDGLKRNYELEVLWLKLKVESQG